MNAGHFVKGQAAWNKKEKLRKLCPKCGVEFFVKPSLDRVVHCSRSCAGKGKISNNRGHKASPETRLKQRIAKLGLRGAAHWNWRNGTSSERKRAMARDEYKQWRAAVFGRDNFTCQWCGARGTILHADHIRAWAEYPEGRFDVDNGRTLCVPCHYKTPTFPKKLIPKELKVGR